MTSRYRLVVAVVSLVSQIAGETLDDLGGVSVWCVDVGVDFGSEEWGSGGVRSGGVEE